VEAQTPYPRPRRENRQRRLGAISHGGLSAQTKHFVAVGSPLHKIPTSSGFSKGDPRAKEDESWRRLACTATQSDDRRWIASARPTSESSCLSGMGPLYSRSTRSMTTDSSASNRPPNAAMSASISTGVSLLVARFDASVAQAVSLVAQVSR